MNTQKLIVGCLLVAGITTACHIPPREEVKSALLPAPTLPKADSLGVKQVALDWIHFFPDSLLQTYIQQAIQENRELKITKEEVAARYAEIEGKRGEYLPQVSPVVGMGVDKSSHFSRMGALEEGVAMPGARVFPKPLPDFAGVLQATWEVDIWKRLRNARQAAIFRFQASQEGQQWQTTQVVAEVASLYYEIQTLDRLVALIQQSVQVQDRVIELVHKQKENARANQLAVSRLEAQRWNTQNLRYTFERERVGLANQLRMLMGQWAGPIVTSPMDPNGLTLPSYPVDQWVRLRPDCRQAEQEVQAARMDVEVVRAQFLPSLTLRSGVGLQAFRPDFLVRPEALALSLLGDMAAPWINRKALMAQYQTAQANQRKAIWAYDQTLLKAHQEITTHWLSWKLLEKNKEAKSNEVRLLEQANGAAWQLYQNARADYSEVLLTQRETLEAQRELVEIEWKQWQTRIQLYRSLGGG